MQGSCQASGLEGGVKSPPLSVAAAVMRRGVLGCALQRCAVLAGSGLKGMRWLRGLQEAGDVKVLAALSACQNCALGGRKGNQGGLEGCKGCAVLAQGMFLCQAPLWAAGTPDG